MGHSGLVGSSIFSAYPDAETFNSSNIREIAGRNFDLLFIAALPAAKWWANQNPEEDTTNRLALENLLLKVISSKTVLISTVDVFAQPYGVDEDTTGEFQNLQAYGTNRRLFEIFIQKLFSRTWVVRLPGLVGTGLKKNVLFDIKFEKNTHSIPINSTFQFYPLSRLNDDLNAVLGREPGTYHFAVEPLSMAEISGAIGLPADRFGPSTQHAPKYDVWTSRLSDGNYPYLVSKAESLKAIKKYVAEEC